MVDAPAGLPGDAGAADFEEGAEDDNAGFEDAPLVAADATGDEGTGADEPLALLEAAGEDDVAAGVQPGGLYTIEIIEFRVIAF